MSKGKNKYKKQQSPAPTKDPQVEQTNQIPPEIAAMHSKKVSTEEVLETISNAPDTEQMKKVEESGNLKQAWENVKDLWKLADSNKAKYEEKQEKLRKEKEELSKKEEEIKDRETRTNQLEKEIKSKEDELLFKEEDLIIREKNAEEGFREQRKKCVESLKNEIDSLTEQIDELRKKIDSENLGIEKRKLELEQEYQTKREFINEERKALNTSIDQQKQKLENDFQEKLQEFQKKWDSEFQEKKKQLQEEKRSLKVEREIFEEDKNYFNEKLESKVAAEKERFESDKKDLEAKLEEARKIRNEKEEKLRQREEADRRFGNKTPEEILVQLDSLKKHNDELRGKLASKADDTALSRLEELERKEQEWNEKKRELDHEIFVLKNKEHSSKIEVSKYENLREENESLLSRIKLKEQIIEDLQKDVDTYTKKAEEKKPFPACSKMDENDELQKETQVSTNVNNLTDLVKKSRIRIASTNNPLYYSENTIRTFVAGLAMSKLTILQGISGTGKTSLPISFAKAIGGEYKIIEVQSGWKDRQDLIGYYNTFEGKYYESEFLKALYEASCPLYKNRPYFIILDEMNLSHPEHYFADFLSMLEQQEDKRELKLITHSLPNTPKLIEGDKIEEGDKIKEGYKIKIPSNVWFIGTANHDETTVQFAPKTIDRANIMEMPKNIESFTGSSNESLYITMDELSQYYKNAIDKRKGDVKEPIEYLNTVLKKELEKFDIGWGNRLESQLQKFIPVYLESGGKIEEAMDHIVSTKIFRNLKDRYDIKVDDLKKLKEAFIGENSFAKHLGKNEINSKELESVRFLEQEISKRDSNQDS